MNKLLKILIIMLLASNVMSAMAISVSMSTNAGSQSMNIVLPESSNLRIAALASSEGIISDAEVSGYSEMSHTMTGGGKSFSSSISGENVEVSQAATQGGVSGSISSFGTSIVSPEEVEYFAATGEAVYGSSLTKGGYELIYTINDRNIALGGIGDCTWWWWNPGIDVKVNLENVYYTGGVVTQSEMLTPLINGMNLWNVEALKYGPKSFKSLGATTKTYDGGLLGDGENTISWTSSLPQQVVAQTRVRYNPTTRAITDADIGFSRQNAALLDQPNMMGKVINHELGHVEGIYELDLTSSTMHYNVNQVTQAPSALDSTTKNVFKYKMLY